MDTTSQALARTPLYNLHLELGARMVPFAGYEMPVQYPAGVLKEHNHTRAQAGLFDVSHMGQVRLSGVGAAAALESLVPVDVVDLPLNFQRYAMFTNEQGGILDDLMISNGGDHLFLVVNAACKQQDVAHMKKHLAGRCQVEELTDRALLALQGPAAGAVMARLAPETAKMIFMNTAKVTLVGLECYISRSGYTGEDGFEISVPETKAEELARLLLAQPEVAPIGLGARDSLRLEAGLCLYGHDMDTNTTPVEASLAWALSKARRADGARAGGYPGADVILGQLAGGVSRKRVGLAVRDRMPVREGAELVNAEGQTIGKVTSGGFGPTVGAPVAMGYVETGFSKIGTVLNAIVRGKPVPVEVVKTPFTPQRYYRG
ncbi:MAG TPA: glycine cleavage system aminomethyltransferase GcvT [Noviherbaspirillum sp.]|uniref:glycine cleavage system aminomethyltransferase GcvT n=1 Tax=Noviherbaspirillum sp. TaxID=1926288 RepID=UPI002B459F5A|nr:glycine cleavage system aminomethyltransferase GcvT [Noviherbaspirillum sp.]HJV87052.1 glycine cleavage system aminomethyltransferase GcvT [Noviherbaspirillum sp.]